MSPTSGDDSELRQAMANLDFTDGGWMVESGAVVLSLRVPVEWSAEIVAETRRRGRDNPSEVIKAMVREGLDRAAADDARETRTIETLSDRRASDDIRAALRATGNLRDYPYDPAGARQRLTKGRVSPDVRVAAIARLAERMGRTVDEIRDHFDS